MVLCIYFNLFCTEVNSNNFNIILDKDITVTVELLLEKNKRDDIRLKKFDEQNGDLRLFATKTDIPPWFKPDKKKSSDDYYFFSNIFFDGKWFVYTIDREDLIFTCYAKTSAGKEKWFIKNTCELMPVKDLMNRSNELIKKSKSDRKI